MRLVVLVGFAFALGSSSALAETATAGSVTASDFVAQLGGDGYVELREVTVVGDVDLLRLGRVTQPLRCDRCTFTGTFRASHVVFERSVELAGSTFYKDGTFEGALFKDRVSLDGVTFGAHANLASATFADTATFAGTSFPGGVTFDGSRLRGRAFFADGRFGGDATFKAVEFGGKADFGQAAFSSASSFEGAIFAGRPSFLLARFHRPAMFHGAELRDGANFEFANFAEGLSFERATGGGILSLNGTEITGRASFQHISSTGRLELDGVVLHEGRLLLDQISLNSLSMSLAHIDALANAGVKKEVLRLLERSHKDRGDLSKANDARYELMRREAREARGRWAVWWHAMYRGMGGYLVRPLNPLLGLLAFVGVATATRSIARAVQVVVHRRHTWSNAKRLATRPEAALPPSLRWLRQPVRLAARAVAAIPRPDGAGPPAVAPGPGRPPSGTRAQRKLGRIFTAFSKLLTGVFRALAASLSTVVRRKADIALGDANRFTTYLSVALRWAEFLAYKVLLACFVLALANANPTVRQLFESVRS